LWFNPGLESGFNPRGGVKGKALLVVFVGSSLKKIDGFPLYVVRRLTKSKTGEKGCVLIVLSKRRKKRKQGVWERGGQRGRVAVDVKRPP